MNEDLNWVNTVNATAAMWMQNWSIFDLVKKKIKKDEIWVHTYQVFYHEKEKKPKSRSEIN